MQRYGRNPKRIERDRVFGFLAVAVLLHLLAYPLVKRITSFDVNAPGRRVQLVSLKNSAQLNPHSRVHMPEVEKREEEAKFPGQVVDIPATADNTPVPNARFLSEHNTHVDHETRSRHQGLYDKIANAPMTTHPAAPVTPVAPGAVNPATKQAQKERIAAARSAAREHLALSFDDKLQSEANGESAKSGVSSEAGAKRDPSVMDLVPKVGVLASMEGGPSNDHLDGVEEGEATLLNSREFKYASFFNRLKHTVSEQWHPLSEVSRRDPSGNIYGSRDRVTVLNVTLNAEGNLKAVAIQRSSGVDFLDDEAVQAFHRAQPFPNPPKGLADGTGDISFPFGFYVEFSRGGLRLPGY